MTQKLIAHYLLQAQLIDEKLCAWGNRLGAPPNEEVEQLLAESLAEALELPVERLAQSR